MRKAIVPVALVFIAIVVLAAIVPFLAGTARAGVRDGAEGLEFNIVEVDRDKSLKGLEAMDTAIKVAISGKSTIYAIKTDHYAILDDKSWDDNGAVLAVKTDKNASSYKYKVWILLRNDPGEFGIPCLEMSDSLCLLNEFEIPDKNPREGLTNLTSQIMWIFQKGDLEVSLKKHLFEDSFEGVLWELDLAGNKVARFKITQ